MSIKSICYVTGPATSYNHATLHYKVAAFDYPPPSAEEGETTESVAFDYARFMKNKYQLGVIIRSFRLNSHISPFVL